MIPCAYSDSIREPAYIRDIASIRTTDLYRQSVLQTRLIFDTQFLLKVLQYSVSQKKMTLYFV